MRSFAILALLAIYIAASLAHPLYGPRPKSTKPRPETERNQGSLDLSSLDFPGGAVSGGGSAPSADDWLKESKRWGKGKRSAEPESRPKQPKYRGGRHRHSTTPRP